MRKLRASYAPVIVIGVLAMATAVAGGALAASSTHGAIKACVNHKNGTLYKAKHCKRHDQSLEWNKQGPRGKAGTNGAVHGFAATHAGAVDFTSATAGSPKTILTESLPAGSFIINAKTVTSETHSTVATALLATCALSDGRASDNSQVWLPDTNIYDPAEGTAPLPFDLAVTSTSPSVVKLACWAQVTAGGQTFNASNSVITAIQTASNTTS